jgi:hypothetical protein
MPSTPRRADRAGVERKERGGIHLTLAIDATLTPLAAATWRRGEVVARRQWVAPPGRLARKRSSLSTRETTRRHVESLARSGRIERVAPSRRPLPHIPSSALAVQ